MRISDWSSDVCSSDLGVGRAEAGTEVAQPLGAGPHDEGLRAELLGEVQAVIAGIGLGDGRELARPLPVEGPAVDQDAADRHAVARSEEHTSELQSLMRISYAVFCLKKKKTNSKYAQENHNHMYKY